MLSLKQQQSSVVAASAPSFSAPARDRPWAAKRTSSICAQTRSPAPSGAGHTPGESDEFLSPWSVNDDDSVDGAGSGATAGTFRSPQRGACGAVPEVSSDAAPRDAPSKAAGGVDTNHDGQHSNAGSDGDDGNDATTTSTDARKQLRRLLRGTKIYFESSLRDIVALAGHELGFTITRRAEDADIVWVETPHSFGVEAIQGMRPSQRINYFPGMKLAATKCELASVFNRLRCAYGDDEFPFVPRTFCFPGGEAALAAFAATAEKTTATTTRRAPGKAAKVFVVKPDAGSCGDGIYLTNDVRNIRHSPCVVQEYVASPLLLGGTKFDLRVYVALTSLAPTVRFVLFREGLCRMAVEPYEAPSTKNFHKLNMHLTNYSLNKFSSSFVPNTSARNDEDSSKRSITTAFEQLRAEHGDAFDEAAFWASLSELVATTLAACRPYLLCAAGVGSASGLAPTQGGATPTSSDDKNEDSARSPVVDHCFHLIGFDILVDSDFRLHLLEINNHPSLQCDAPIDFSVKGRVLRPLLCLAARAAANRRGRRATVDDAVLAIGGGEVAPDGVFSRALLADADRWEAAVVAASGIGDRSDDAAVARLLARYDAPLAPLRAAFVSALGACRGGPAVAAAAGVSSSRMLRMARQWGLVHCEDAPMRSSEIRQGTTDFQTFLDAVLDGYIGDATCPGTGRRTPARLHGATAFFRRVNAEGGV